ncbi:MAG: NYN domain-containing protein [Candidatus Saccharibacteria bacterium]|nr:NYN domain-containing protein [Candidatus Saccharibacteria bacterium]
MRRRRKTPRVYAFIDSQNLNVSVQRLGWKMDWKKFRQFLTDKYGVSQAYMFIGYIPEQEKMYEQLHDTGFAVVLKPTFDMTRPRPEGDDQDKSKSNTAEEDKHVKGNVDADLVLWAMKEMKHYDKAIIVSGDGDFYSLVEYLEAENKLLKLLAPSGHYSNLYNRYEEYVDRIDAFRHELAYREGKRFAKAHRSTDNARSGSKRKSKN